MDLKQFFIFGIIIVSDFLNHFFANVIPKIKLREISKIVSN